MHISDDEFITNICTFCDIVYVLDFYRKQFFPNLLLVKICMIAIILEIFETNNDIDDINRC